MAEYIEREALISELSANCIPIDDRELSGLLGCNESIRDVINAMPTADVRPERHGHWVYHHDIHGISYFCSNCTCGVLDTGAENYCHYCGAKMDRIGG